MLLLIFVLFPVVYCNSVPELKTVLATEAFFIPINYEWFHKFKKDDPLEYSASLIDMPDLPDWMYSHPLNSSSPFLYGSATEPGNVQIEIIALNKTTFDTALTIFELKVEPREKIYQHEVEMKFLNLNVDDMFKSGRLNRLLEIFKTSLWKECEDIYVTKVVSSLDVGGRLPLHPKTKEGVVVRIGGTSEFSRDLEDLDREVQPLRNRFPCPRDYKRTSVEHLFRSRNFITDWCSFHLVSENRQKAVGSSDGHSDHPISSIPLQSGDYNPHVVDAPRRDFFFDFLVSIVIPTVIVLALSTALTCIMCCNKEGADKNDGAMNMQLDQYDLTNRLSTKRDSMQPVGSTPLSSFPASRNDSPTSTLPKASTLRTSSRSGTLRSASQPPPPPYATASLPPSYMGSSRSNLSPCLQ